MKMKRIVGGNIESNGYIIYKNEGGEAFIIDPGYKGESFLKEASLLNLNIKGIILTHHHYDHVGGVDKIKMATGCKLYLHRADLDMYKKHVDVILEDGDKLYLDNEELEIINTKGHTKGSICIYSKESKVIFTGDTVFNVDLGRTDLADGSQKEMEFSVKNIISKWGNDITIYPGHGDSATMKYVRKNNFEYLEIMES
jgi:hydroxyacylglutathione hydrolase